MGWPPRRRDAAAEQQESDDELDAIGRDFPGWQPWRSTAGRWWAGRLEPGGSPPGAPAEWAKTVHGDTPEDLRAALTGQERLASHAR